MRSFTRFLSKSLLFTYVLIFSSCGETFNPNTETYFVSAESKKWLVDTDLYDEFLMEDSLFLSERFFFDSEWIAFNSSRRTSGLLGLQEREFKEYEVIHQVYLTQNLSYSIELKAYEPPQGTVLEVQLGRIQYRYDLQLNRLLSISSNLGHRPKNEFVNDQLVDLPFLSLAVRHDTLIINNVAYFNTLEFVLADFEEQWTDSTIISIAVAREVGLLQYKMHNGHVFNRKAVID